MSRVSTTAPEMMPWSISGMQRMRTVTSPPCSTSSVTGAPMENAIWTTVLSRPSSSSSEEHTSELQSLIRISYAVFCLQKKNHTHILAPSHNQYQDTTNTNKL